MNCIKNYFSETTVPFLKGNLSGMFLVWSCTKFVFYVDQKWTNNCLKGPQWKINKYLLWNHKWDWTQTALKWCYINKLIYNLWPGEFKGEPQLLILIFSWQTWLLQLESGDSNLYKLHCVKCTNMLHATLQR
jgi:hypothetical protein